MKRAMFTAITLLWAACAGAAPGDATITFTVPLNLQKLDPEVKKVRSYCEVKDSGSLCLPQPLVKSMEWSVAMPYLAIRYRRWWYPLPR